MCGGSDTTTITRPADTTVDTSQQQYADGQERAKRVYKLNQPKKKTLEGDLNSNPNVGAAAVLGA